MRTEQKWLFSWLGGQVIIKQENPNTRNTLKYRIKMSDINIVTMF